MRISTLHDLHPSALVRRCAAIAVFACAGTIALQAQQPAVLSAAASAPAIFPAIASSNDIGYSSSVGAPEASAAENFIPAADSSVLQPPPRRRYGSPRYADNSHNPDGSNKWTGEAGVGATIPVGNTLKYDTDSYAYSVGFGRQWSKKFALLAQFDWDNFGLQGANLQNQSNLYFGQPTGVGLDGNAHVWSFSLDPVYNYMQSDTLGAYVVMGVGFFHKVTTFTLPQTACADYYCQFQYVVNANLDHYTSNAPGFDGGLGLTYKFSRFASEKFFLEARYVFVDNSQRTGLTTANENSAAYGPNGSKYTGSDFYPANSNRTGYIPIKVGLRF
jgi:hypothetical protein